MQYKVQRLRGLNRGRVGIGLSHHQEVKELPPMYQQVV